MSGVQEDVHHSADLVATVCPLQLLLSPAGLGVELPGQQLGAISPSLQGPQPIAGPSNASPVGLPEADQSLVLDKGGTRSPGIANLIHRTYHPCLGQRSRQPYSAPGGKIAMNSLAAETLKQQIPLLDYVEGQDWKPARRIARGRLMGLCPLHADRKPSFLLDPNKNLFYCYGCGRGGDVIRFAELYHGVPFGRSDCAPPPLVGRRLVAERRDQVLPGSAPSSSGSGGVSGGARCATAGVNRANAHRLRARPLSTGLVDEHGLCAPRFAASRRGHARRLRCLCSSHRLSARCQPLRTQHR